MAAQTEEETILEAIDSAIFALSFVNGFAQARAKNSGQGVSMQEQTNRVWRALHLVRFYVRRHSVEKVLPGLPLEIQERVAALLVADRMER